MTADALSEFLSLRTTTVVVVVGVNAQRTTEPVEEVEVVDAFQLLNGVAVFAEDGCLVARGVRLVGMDEFRFAEFSLAEVRGVEVGVEDGVTITDNLAVSNCFFGFLDKGCLRFARRVCVFHKEYSRCGIGKQQPV